MNILYTIGYATYDFDTFIQKMKDYTIGAIADVRSSPYSAYYKEFNRESLERILTLHNVFYVFMGNELGARPKDNSVYENGKVNFEAMEQLPSFQHALSRLHKGLEKYSIALICSERDPLKCHRAILICKALRNKCDIKHIGMYLDTNNKSKELELHTELEVRLRGKYNPFKQGSLLFNQEEELLEAYRKQAKRIAFTEDKNDEIQNID